MLCVQAQAGQAQVRFFDDGFAQNLSTVETAPRPPLAVDGGTVRDCRQFADAWRRGAIPEEARETRPYASYAICSAAEALRAAKPATGRPLVPAGVAAQVPAQAVAERLDLGSFASSFGPRVARCGTTTAAQLGVVPTVLSDHALDLGEGGWTRRLDVLAAADFDGDGQEDWLARLVDRAAPPASYDSTRYLILSAGPDGLIRGADLDPGAHPRPPRPPCKP